MATKNVKGNSSACESRPGRDTGSTHFHYVKSVQPHINREQCDITVADNVGDITVQVYYAVPITGLVSFLFSLQHNGLVHVPTHIIDEAREYEEINE